MTASAADAKRYAFRLLGYRDRSEAELKERLLRKGFSAAIADETVTFMKNSGFLDDVRLADRLRHQAMTGKLLGFQAAKALLVRRGIPAACIASALHYNEQEELDHAVRLLKKKLGAAEVPTEKERRKLWNFLNRRGYSVTVIRRAMQGIGMQGEEDL